MALNQGQLVRLSHTRDGSNKRTHVAVVSAVETDEATGDLDVTFAVFDAYERGEAVRNERLTIPASVDTSGVIDLDYLAARAQVQAAPVAAAIVQAADPQVVAAVAQQILTHLAQQGVNVPGVSAVAPPVVPSTPEALGFPPAVAVEPTTAAAPVEPVTPESLGL